MIDYSLAFELDRVAWIYILATGGQFPCPNTLAP